MGSAVLAVARPSVCCGESGQAQLRHPVCVCVPLRPHSTVMTLIHAPGFHVVPHEHAGGEGRCCASLGCPEGNVGVARIGCACSSFASVAPITSPSHSTFHSGVPWVVAARSPLLLVLRRLRRAGLQPPRSRVHWSVPPPPTGSFPIGFVLSSPTSPSLLPTLLCCGPWLVAPPPPCRCAA